MQVDKGNKVIQGFAPQSIVSVTAGAAWTPTSVMEAFCVPSDCTYTIDGTGLSGTLYAGDIRVIVQGKTYTFNTTMSIEVA